MISFKELNFEWPSKLDLNPAILECSHVKSLGIQLQFEDSRTWRSNMSEQRISIPFFMAFNVGHIGCLYLTLLANGVKWLHFDKQNKKIKTLKRNHAFHCLPACGTRIVQGGIKKNFDFPCSWWEASPQRQQLRTDETPRSHRRGKGRCN